MRQGKERFVERLPLVFDQPFIPYLLTLFFCGAGFLLRHIAAGFLPDGYPFVTFFPAVILSSFLFGVRPGIFAAVLCGCLAWFFFIPPYGDFGVTPGVLLAMGFYTGVVAIDILLIHYMQRANFHLALERERSTKLAETHELLFHELQHRVSNNLQVVAAMLTLQRRHIDHDVARRALDDASGRLALVGRISRALYDPSGAGQDMGTFFKTLSANILEASGRADISITVDAPTGLTLDPSMTVPVALIVTEAVSNAIEHGLPDRTGHIGIVLESADDKLIFKVCDNGLGVAPDFDIGQSDSLGLRIAQALSAQLGGCFSLKPDPCGGTVAWLELPNRTA